MNQSIDLEAAKAAFFASGGQLVVLEGFQYRPLPARKHPAPSKHKRRGLPAVQNGTRQEKAKARADAVAELAATMTWRQASEHLNVPQPTLWDIAKRNGFTFIPAIKGKHLPKPDDEERDARLAQRIQALRDEGLSRHRATITLEIGHTTMTRIIRKFDIDYPVRRAQGDL